MALAQKCVLFCDFLRLFPYCVSSPTALVLTNAWLPIDGGKGQVGSELPGNNAD
jgi:hypothetical protein